MELSDINLWKFRQMERQTMQTTSSGQTTRKGRPPAQEKSQKREQEIAALEQLVESKKKRLDELRGAERKAQKAARRAQLNQRKYSVGGLAQIAGLLEVDVSFLLGAFLSVADMRESDGTWPDESFRKFKARGAAELATREAARKANKRSGVDADEDDSEFDALAQS
jgi:hypothetical protein